MRLSRIAMFPFTVAGGYILYEMLYNYKYEWSYYLILPVVAIAACLALYPQIDEIGYRWWPPKADPMIEKILSKSCPSLKWVKEEDRNMFFVRCLDAIRRVEFIGMKVEDIPTDVKVMSLYPAMLLEYMFGVELIKHYGRVVLYKHPFPSPEHEAWHSAETHHEDGVVLFSLEQLILNYSRPGDFYHVGFDAWIQALFQRQPTLKDIPSMTSSMDWDSDDLIHDKAMKYLGLNTITNEMINWHAFLNHSEAFLNQYPDSFNSMLTHLKQTASS